jgi:hypothetical protein
LLLRAVLVPGHYARSMKASSRAITGAGLCPQRFFCPGSQPVRSFDPTDPTAISTSDPTVKPCPAGTFTQELGATSEQQCCKWAAAYRVRACVHAPLAATLTLARAFLLPAVTPPGFFTANEQTLVCPAGHYRAGWLPAAQASECRPCGDGVRAAQTDSITLFDPATGAQRQLPVTSSNSDCFIQPGQGLYSQVLSGTYRAKDCTDGYGVSNVTFGLTPAPCK